MDGAFSWFSFLRMGSGIVLTVAVAGCQKPAPESTAITTEPPKVEAPFDPMGMELRDQRLIVGRDVWINTCAECHLKGLGGAPRIADPSTWQPRIQKGKDVLYDHAIKGFYGDVGEMPPRGGNERLSDEQIKQAVDFVVYASQ